MHLIRLASVAAVVLVGAVEPKVAFAQQSDASGPHRWALSVSGDVGTFPAIDGGGCGERGKTVGYGGSVIYRPSPRFSLEAVTRTFREPTEHQCVYPAGFPLIQPGAGAQLISTSSAAPRPPLMESELRVGYETPTTMPPVRLTIGAGSFWHGAALPMAALAIGTGTRGPGLRLFAELETKVARLPQTNTYFVERTDSMGVTHDSSFSTRGSKALHWSTLHLGIEIPLASATAGQSLRRRARDLQNCDSRDGQRPTL